MDRTRPEDRTGNGPDRKWTRHRSEQRDFTDRRRPRREVSPSRGRSRRRRRMSSGSSSATSFDRESRRDWRHRRRHGRSRRHHSSTQPLTPSSETTQILLAIAGLKSATNAVASRVLGAARGRDIRGHTCGPFTSNPTCGGTCHLPASRNG